jgi:hypothetical protein
MERAKDKLQGYKFGGREITLESAKGERKRPEEMKDIEKKTGYARVALFS